MCLCAFLYFTEFSTVNINYFCNQKKSTMLFKEKNILPIQVLQGLYLSVTERDSHNSPQMGSRAGAAPLSPLWCWSRHPESCRSPVNTSQLWRPRDQSLWQLGGPVRALPQCGDSPAGRTSTVVYLRQPKVTKGPWCLVTGQWSQDFQGLKAAL